MKEFQTEKAAKKACDEVNKTDRNVKFCPLIRDLCKNRKCMAWVKSGTFSERKSISSSVMIWNVSEPYCNSPIITGQLYIENYP